MCIKFEVDMNYSEVYVETNVNVKDTVSYSTFIQW